MSKFYKRQKSEILTAYTKQYVFNETAETGKQKQCRYYYTYERDKYLSSRRSIRLRATDMMFISSVRSINAVSKMTLFK